MNFFYRLKIRVKVTIIASLSCLIVLLLTQSYSMYSGLSELELQLTEQRQMLLESFDNNIKTQVQNVVSLAMGIYRDHQAGKLTLEEAKERAKESIRHIRYGKDGYFWIDAYDGINVLFPTQPGDEGKSRLDLKDTNGTYLIKEIIANGRKSDGGFTDYWFPNQVRQNLFPKEAILLQSNPLAG